MKVHDLPEESFLSSSIFVPSQVPPGTPQGMAEAILFGLLWLVMEGHEWQAQRIIGERQTPSGLEYEVSLEKTLWLPKATLDTKLVRRYRADQRAATRVRTRWPSRLQEAGGSVRLQRRSSTVALWRKVAGETASANDPRILEYYVADGERSGRPEISDEVEEGLLVNVRGSRSGI